MATKVKRGTCSFTQKYAILKSLPCFHSILWRKEVRHMPDILSFLLSVAAGVVANYIYKWLDEQDKDSKH